MREEYGSDPRSYEHYLSWLVSSVVELALVSQRSWIQKPYGSEFGPYLNYYLSGVLNCEDHFHIRVRLFKINHSKQKLTYIHTYILFLILPKGLFRINLQCVYITVYI